MKLQIKHEQWQCSITSFAMALDIPLDKLIDIAGHDGREIIFPDLPEPVNRRGHNTYELIQLAICLGYSVTPVPLRPSIKPDCNSSREFFIGSENDNWKWFIGQILTSKGIIECQGPRCYHMLAYERGHIFDPDGYEFLYSRRECEERGLFTYCLWRIDRILK